MDHPDVGPHVIFQSIRENHQKANVAHLDTILHSWLLIKLYKKDIHFRINFSKLCLTGGTYVYLFHLLYPHQWHALQTIYISLVFECHWKIIHYFATFLWSWINGWISMKIVGMVWKSIVSYNSPMLLMTLPSLLVLLRSYSGYWILFLSIPQCGDTN